MFLRARVAAVRQDAALRKVDELMPGMQPAARDG